jgi:short-subunit dehydrogenase
MRFEKQIVCVTGASRGIGLAVAKAFAREGATAVLTAREEARLERERAGIMAAGGDAWCHPMDVTCGESVKAAVDAIHARFGRVDVLINNAGVAYQDYFVDCAMEKMRREFEVNCLGLMRVTQAFLPEMIRRRSGVIMNISSLLGMAPFPTEASYSATKAAVLAFTQALRGEVSTCGIHVGVFLPGHTRTDMADGLRMSGGPAPVAVEVVAEAILDAVARKKKLATIPGPAANIGLQMIRHFPGFSERMMTDIARQSMPTQDTE